MPRKLRTWEALPATLAIIIEQRTVRVPAPNSDRIYIRRVPPFMLANNDSFKEIPLKNPDPPKISSFSPSISPTSIFFFRLPLFLLWERRGEDIRRVNFFFPLTKTKLCRGSRIKGQELPSPQPYTVLHSLGILLHSKSYFVITLLFLMTETLL